ncbi:hypothetical protein OSB04_030145 [Centaurea solstitialis]|uniref:S-protein homolog n=1 Tax=Centaurea solstitialis TaxID=347529 RepID=A0AA38VSY7_9ASTR|nr:hypothetical protein OSB04_030145 [Centaurea solstitialis]
MKILFFVLTFYLVITTEASLSANTTNASLAINTTTDESSASNKICFFDYWSVFIYDGINEPITVHVQSGDDDLGNRTISVNGYTKWSFCMNIGFKTRFYAHFYWNSRTAFFDVFDYDTSKAFCDNHKLFKKQRCLWLVRDDGFYLAIGQHFNPFPDGWVKLHDWS